MKKEKRKKTRKSILAITVYCILFIVIIIVAIIFSTKPSTKPPSQEYFKVENAAALADPNPNDPQNQKIKIKFLSFELTPIKGDAHEVHIDPGGALPTDEWPHYPLIKANETEHVEITLKNPVIAYKEGEYWTLEIRVWCEESSWDLEEQRIKVYIKNWYPYS
ncbi:MAG: hypothetical protein DRG83_04815 [Deltaproteobacteria bacterium]|nr:MAG: hypothetical protein DRG83_04815 [Deltaproteobacteria bacterium]